MKIHFGLAWSDAVLGRRDFNSELSYGLFADYLKRISHFSPCTAGALKKNLSGTALWLCDTSRNAKALSSEELSRFMGGLLNGGKKELCVAIGGPDGWDAAAIARLKPHLLWSLGPLTLPHELAAVVAAEQVYRAFTILRGLPYHRGHSGNF